MPSILITGGSGKFGRVLIAHFLERGWDVLFTSTSADRVREVELEMSGYERSPLGFIADFSQASSAVSLVDEVLQKAGEVTCLVNNARSLKSLAVDDNDMTSRKNFMDEFMMDVVVPYELAVLLSRRSFGEFKAVVNVGSQYGRVAANPALYNGDVSGLPIQYGVSKAALCHLTKELAVRFASRGIRVNCVAFGGVSGRVDEEFERRYATLCPSGSMLSESDIAGPVEFLACEMSSGMTGETILVDGGWTVW